MKMLQTGERAPADTVAALGTFDGVHLGHKKIIQTLKDLAAEKGLASLVCTFSNVPASYFRPEEVGALSTADEKQAALEEAGVDLLLMQPFDAHMAQISPEAFVDGLADVLRVRAIVVGFNFTFGHKARGNAQFLTEYAGKKGIEVHILPPVEVGGSPVSSTRIRTLLCEGDASGARELLGYGYKIQGEVVNGKKLGRLLGFPTANCFLQKGKLCPKKGVYISMVHFDGQTHCGITNIGQRPTVRDGDRLNVETHILGFDGDLYGHRITVCLRRYLRGETRFNDVEELRLQMEQDKRCAEEYFSLYKG
ncbi:MAG: bifunctional riboflavin kinase/FAD synthetase [Christensenellaceae bacterium]|nr:bifunctional riboflavin kinase/FAD synthetase [Christensenellaceae bacterium]